MLSENFLSNMGWEPQQGTRWYFKVGNFPATDHRNLLTQLALLYAPDDSITIEGYEASGDEDGCVLFDGYVTNEIDFMKLMGLLRIKR